MDDPGAQAMNTERMRDLFRELVTLQDSGADVTRSRSTVAASFQVDLSEVMEIERRGITERWPPLG